MSDEILYEKIGRVGLLTLNRPARLNAFNAATARRFWALLDEIRADHGVRAVVLTGAGRGFCAGADLRALGGYDGPRDHDWGTPRGMIEFPLRLRALPQPSICAVNGVAAGGGFGVAMAADFRIASENARFGAVQIRSGRPADAGLTYLLPRLLGLERALRLMLTGELIDAHAALALGLVSEVTPPEQLLARSLALAEQLAAGPRLAMQRTRQAAYRALETNLDEALSFEYQIMVECSTHPDVAEGTRAFVEKRPPRFQ